MILTPRCKFRERDGEGDYSTLLLSSVSLKKQNSLVLFGLLLVVNYLIFLSDYFFFLQFFFLRYESKMLDHDNYIVELFRSNKAGR